MAAFKLYTTTQFRVSKNKAGRFFPLFKNGSKWECFNEQGGGWVSRATRTNAEKFIQRKAARIFYGKALIEVLDEAEQPQEEEEGARVRFFKDLSTQEKIESLTRLIENPYFPQEDREKLLLQRAALLEEVA